MNKNKKAYSFAQKRLFKRYALLLCLSHLAIAALMFADMLFDPADVVIHNIFYYFFEGAMPILTTLAMAAIACAFVHPDKGWLRPYILLHLGAVAISSLIPTLLTELDSGVFTLEVVILISIGEALLDMTFSLAVTGLFLLVCHLLLKKHSRAVFLEKITFLWGIFSLVDLLISPIAEFIALCIEAGGVLYPNEILLFLLSLVLCVVFAYLCLYTFKKTYPRVEEHMLA